MLFFVDQVLSRNFPCLEASIAQVKKKSKKKKQVATSAMSMGDAMEWVRKILKIMGEEHKDVELPGELAKTLETPEKTLRDGVHIKVK